MSDIKLPLMFCCANGCGVCGVTLKDFVTHATQAQDGDPWVTVESEPQIVSDCCGAEVEIWDERKQDVVASVRAAVQANVPNGMVLVNAGALNMIINVLRRDADEGRTVRGEMADEILLSAIQKV